MSCLKCLHRCLCDMYEPQREVCNAFLDEDLYLKLPCKIGEVVYKLVDVDTCTNTGCYSCDPGYLNSKCPYVHHNMHIITTAFTVNMIDEINKSIFLTESDAMVERTKRGYITEY